jgi:uncharacterized protein YraI
MQLRKIGLLVVALVATAAVFTALPALADDEVMVTAGGTTNVRSGPGTEYSIIGVLFAGDTSEAVGRDSTGNDWLLIEYDDGDGWVATSVVSIEGDPTTLDIVEDSGGDVTVGNTDVTATVESETNVRFGPGSSYAIVGTTSDSQTFDVTGITVLDYPLLCRGSRIYDTTGNDDTEDVWLQVNYNGYSAWVNYNVVSVSGSLCDVDELDDEDVEEEQEELIDTVLDELDDDVVDSLDDVVVVTLENTNLRLSNYPTSEILDVIPYDTTLVAEARDEDSERIRVTYRDETGWISVSLVSITRGSVDDLPVEEE